MKTQVLKAVPWAASLLLAALLLRPIVTVTGLAGPPLYAPPDLMQFYFAGQLAAGNKIASLYDKSAYEPLVRQMQAQGERITAHPFNRPAFAAYACIPLTWFSYRTALVLVTIGNLLLLGFLVWKLPGWLGGGDSVRPWLVAFVPFLMGIGLGQDNLILVMLMAYSLHLAGRGKEALAGIFLGCCLFKPHLIWAMPLALLAAGKRRMFGWFLGTAFTLAAASFAAIGVSGVRDWLHVLQLPSTDYNPGSMSNVRALGIHFGAVPALAVALAAVACFCVVLWRSSSGEKLAASVAASLLLSPHTYEYDLSLLAVAALLIRGGALRLVLLLPWPYFYTRPDLIPWIILSVAFLGALALAAVGVERPFEAVQLWWRRRKRPLAVEASGQEAGPG